MSHTIFQQNTGNNFKIVDFVQMIQEIGLGWRLADVTRPKLHAFCGRTVLGFNRAGKEGFASLYMFSLCTPLIQILIVCAIV